MLYGSPTVRNWNELILLRDGSDAQKAAYASIEGCQLKALFTAAQIAFIGEIALGLDGPARLGDQRQILPFVCSWPDLADFETQMRKNFWDRKAIRIEPLESDEEEGMVCEFLLPRFTIRIVARMAPLVDQPEHQIFQSQLRLLHDSSAAKRAHLEKLCLEGWKLEDAFGAVFSLSDARKTLLAMDDLDSENLHEVAQGRKIAKLRKELTKVKDKTKVTPSSAKKSKSKRSSAAKITAADSDRKKVPLPTLSGAFEHFVRSGVWGWIVQKKHETRLRIVPELKHEFRTDGLHLRIIYMKRGSLREVLVEVALETEPEPALLAADPITIPVRCRHKMEMGEYPVLAVWARRYRAIDEKPNRVQEYPSEVRGDVGTPESAIAEAATPEAKPEKTNATKGKD